MRVRTAVWISALALVVAALGWIVAAPRPAFSAADEARLAGGDALRGRMVFDAAQCASCHASPGQPDRLRLGGGLALGTPFGTFRVPNISTHPTDGIGRWSAVEIANAVKSGVSPSGQHYYPAFPYPSYVRMEVEDLRDLVAYLRTLGPAEGRPPHHVIPFPLFRVRRGMGLWKLLYLDEQPLALQPERGEAWNRGRYLVEALTHCAECHSPRNLIYGIKEAQRFAGGLNPEQVGSAPNITPAALDHWSEGQLAEFLRTGVSPDLRRVGSTMADVVTNLARLDERDRQAIAAYVKALPARPTAAEAQY